MKVFIDKKKIASMVLQGLVFSVAIIAGSMVVYGAQLPFGDAALIALKGTLTYAVVVSALSFIEAYLRTRLPT